MGRSPYIWVRDTAGQWQAMPKPGRPPYWSASNREAQVAAQQAEGPNPDPTLGRGHRAYAEWLAALNPPAPEVR